MTFVRALYEQPRVAVSCARPEPPPPHLVGARVIEAVISLTDRDLVSRGEPNRTRGLAKPLSPLVVTTARAEAAGGGRAGVPTPPVRGAQV